MDYVSYDIKNTATIPLGVITTTGNNSTYPATLMFDGNIDSTNTSYFSKAGSTIGFIFNEPKNVTDIKIYCGSSIESPKDIYFEVTSDGNEWIELGFATYSSSWSGWKTISVEHKKKYLGYRLRMVGVTVSTSTYIKLREIEMYGWEGNINKTLILHDGEHKKFNATIPSDGGKPIMPIMNSATQDGITITHSSADGSNLGYLAFGVSQWVSSGGANESTPQWVLVDFGEDNKKVVASYQARAYLADRRLATHIFQGSNNGVDFIDLNHSNVSMGVAVERYYFENETPYRYYRIYSTYSTGGNGRASLKDVQFFEKATPVILYNWQTASSTLPTQEQFLTEGMDSLSPLLDRRVETLEPLPMTDKSEILLQNGKLFAKPIDLNKYMDIRKIEVR